MTQKNGMEDAWLSLNERLPGETNGPKLKRGAKDKTAPAAKRGVKAQREEEVDSETAAERRMAGRSSSGDFDARVREGGAESLSVWCARKRVSPQYYPVAPGDSEGAVRKIYVST